MICRMIEKLVKKIWYIDIDVRIPDKTEIEEDWQLEEALNGRR